MFTNLSKAIKNIKEKDPSVRSSYEIFFCYSGLHAVIFHRFNHYLWSRKMYFLARYFATIARFLTGIEIHPAAKIGKNVFIDHGLGVVIGETCIISDNVTIYQGVTLGGVKPSIDSKSQVNVKRHPTIKDGVIIGSAAQVLGDITIGKNARIGSNAVVLQNIEDNSIIVNAPSIVKISKKNKTKFQAYGITDDCEKLQKIYQKKLIEIDQKILELKRMLNNKDH